MISLCPVLELYLVDSRDQECPNSLNIIMAKLHCSTNSLAIGDYVSFYHMTLRNLPVCLKGAQNYINKGNKFPK